MTKIWILVLFTNQYQKCKRGSFDLKLLVSSAVAKGVPILPRDPTWALFYLLFAFVRKNQSNFGSLSVQCLMYNILQHAIGIWLPYWHHLLGYFNQHPLSD